MTRVDDLLRRYVADSGEAGEPVSPGVYLGEVEGIERTELAGLIDAYLDSLPVPDWDPVRFHESGAEKVYERVDRALSGPSGEWPVLLPSLRHQKQKKRSDLVNELASELGVEENGRDKVADYYHGMESGLLESDGVTDRVLEALGRILGCGRDALRKAGRPFGESSGQAGGIVFARVSDGDQPALLADSPELAPSPESWDEVDLLFRGREWK